MASGMNAAKRFTVRLSLVAGSTLATIIGAQSLILLDASKQPAALAVSPNVIPPANTTGVNTAATVVKVAPSIVIIRHPGAVVAQNGPATIQQPRRAAIKPPNPVEIQAPPPIIVQQPAAPAPAQSFSAPSVPTTRSSR